MTSVSFLTFLQTGKGEKGEFAEVKGLVWLPFCRAVGEDLTDCRPPLRAERCCDSDCGVES